MVDHLQSRVTPWRQYASHVNVRGTLSKMDVCCYDDKYSKPVKVYRGKNTVNRFLEEMLKEVEHCKKVVKTKFNKPLIMTDEDKANFEAMNHCHICGHKYIQAKCELGTIAISLGNSEAQHTKNVI